MKKLLSLLALTAIFASCMGAEDTDETTEDTTDEVVVETTVDFSTLSFILPSTWVIDQYPAEDDGTEFATFMVPDEDYEVTLFMDITEYEGGFSEKDMEYTTDLGNGLSYMQDGCNAMACYLLGTDEYKVGVMFYIESTEEAPENLDGVWSPSTDLTQEELLAFLETAELTSK